MQRISTNYKFEAKRSTRLIGCVRRRHRAEPAGMSRRAAATARNRSAHRRRYPRRNRCQPQRHCGGRVRARSV